MPRTNGPAIGFSKNVCSRKPASESAPPRIAAMRMRGRRIFQMMFTSVGLPVLVNRISTIRSSGMGMLPMLMFSTVMRQKAAMRTKNTSAYRARRRA